MSSETTSADSLSPLARLIAALLFVVAYVITTGAVMMVNTTLFGLSDPKFGPSGWTIYWPLWMSCYAPAALLFAVQSSRLPAESGALARFLGSSLVLLLLCVEVTFLFDAQWPWVVGELIALAAVSELLVRLPRRRAFAA